jgi:hypothetical protein
MKSMHAALVIAPLIVVLVSACGAQAMNTPAAASEATKVSVEPTQAMTEASPASDAAVLASSPIPTTNIPSTQESSQGITVSFADDILPLLESRCKNCHGGNKTEEGLILLSYADVMKGSDNGLVVNPGQADNSLLVELLIEQKMPKRGPKLTSPQIQLIIDWINQGALDN